MINGFRGKDGDLAPVPFECEAFGYPHSTSTGETMYNNTHFRTEAEAWDSIRKSVFGGVKLAGDRVLHCREAMAYAEKRAADAAADFTVAMDGLRKFTEGLDQ